MKSKINKFYRQATSNFRKLPDFIIIGAQKGGTSSLAFYLSQHPDIKFAFNKEVHFFDNNFNRGLTWYKSNFPFKSVNRNTLFGEATPFYLFHPLCAERVKESIPNVKIIVLLRNPIDRAFSHYNMQLKNGHETTISFEEAIQLENSRIGPEFSKLNENRPHNNEIIQRYSYLSRGRYYEQLKLWFNLFNRDQFILLKSEDFFLNPMNALDRITNFLNIESYIPANMEAKNQGSYVGLQDETKNRLIDFYRDDVNKLNELTGVNFNWL